MKTPFARRLGRALAVLALIGASTTAAQFTPAAAATPALQSIVPVPASLTPAAGVTFPLVSTTKIVTEAGSAPAKQVGDYLAGVLRPSTGFALPVSDAPASVPSDSIALLLSGAPASVGAQGYQLVSAASSVTVRAQTADGLFAGVQTLRQMLPGRVESPTAQAGPWTVPGATIVDYPRFGYRGAMLDVARHFFKPDQVKLYIDQIAQYKINTLHLHLADDQGWRIEIKSWPRLATYGGSIEVGGGQGGYYTQEQYQDLVRYAGSRGITVIPEIDLPGHTNAALASYAELNCNGIAPPLYDGTEVGFSSLCIDKPITYQFVDDVLRELAALTPGPYLHIGGDEAHSTTEPDFKTFMGKVLPLVAKHGKSAMGWHEFVKTDPPTSAVAQFWGTTDEDADVAAAAARGNKILLSPANKAYLDMKYDEHTVLGQDWAGLIEVKDAYGWNPGAYLKNVPESAIRGVEAPLWTETITNSADIEQMAFPRLPAIAELGWSPQSTHDWNNFANRLAAQAPRWQAAGLNYYPSPQVPWQK